MYVTCVVQLRIPLRLYTKLEEESGATSKEVNK
jgi:hypothetical protein